MDDTTSNSSSFGRGWIPLDRHIGLPGEEPGFLPGTGGERDRRLGSRTSEAGGGAQAGFPDGAGRDGWENLRVPLHHPADGTPPRAGEELVPLRGRADGWTPDRQRAFLENLAACGSVSAAARSVGMSRESAYALRRRAGARGFAQAWDAARVLAAEHLVEVAWDRALNGTIRPIWYHGEQVGEVRHHDSRLLLGLIAQNRALVERGGAGSALASAPVVSAVLEDWDAALARVERGEALPDPGAEGASEQALPQPLPPAGGEQDVCRPGRHPSQRGGPVAEPDETAELELGAYDTWWDEGAEQWLTNWPLPPEWDGEQFRIEPARRGAESTRGAAVPLEPDEEGWIDPEEAGEAAEDGPAEDWARTLTEEELDGLAGQQALGAAERAARIELYRRRAFGLDTEEGGEEPEISAP